MSEKLDKKVFLSLETKKLVHNQKQYGETYNDCIARVFGKYADYKKAGFVL